MFGFLKNKLKEAISKISKKAEEVKVEGDIEEKKSQPEISQETSGFLGLFKKKDIEEAASDEKSKESKKPEEAKEIKEELKEEKGFFSKLTEKLTTKKISEEKFEELFEDLELALLENNVAVEVIDKIKEDLKVDLVDVPLKGKIKDLIEDSLKNSLEDILKETGFDLIDEIKNKKEKPYIIVFVGINGSGKTTTIAKLSYLFEKNNLKSVLVAADTFRAASIQQLEEHANNLKVKLIKHDYNADPSAVSFDGVKYAKSHNLDVVLIDTAGRQHSNKNLMEEMKKIIKVIKPDLKIFIGESITGNDCVIQSTEFDKAISIDGIILAKSDVDDKGGATISVSYVTRKPILYLGTGQNYNDLEKFNKNKIINQIF
jgi:fused signal recognition particle receptor